MRLGALASRAALVLVACGLFLLVLALFAASRPVPLAGVQRLMPAAVSVAIGWPAGVLAALGLWGAPSRLRYAVFGIAVIVLLLPSNFAGAGVTARLAAGARPAALVLLLLTLALNRLDPVMLRSAAAFGASPLRAWRVAVFGPIAGSLAWIFAASCALAIVTQG